MERQLPSPGLADVAGYLPSRRFPSDHLAVLADLRFPQPGAAAGGAQQAGAASGGVAGAGLGGAAAAAGPGAAGGKGGGGAPSASRGGGTGGRVLPAALHHVGQAAEVLAADGVIAVPTDTIYGAPFTWLRSGIKAGQRAAAHSSGCCSTACST